MHEPEGACQSFPETVLIPSTQCNTGETGDLSVLQALVFPFHQCYLALHNFLKLECIQSGLVRTCTNMRTEAAKSVAREEEFALNKVHMLVL